MVLIAIYTINVSVWTWYKFLLNLFVCLFLCLQNYQIFLSQSSKRNHFGIKSCSYQPQKLAFLLNNSKTWIVEHWVVFQFFKNLFSELIIANKIETLLLKQLDFLLSSCRKNIAYIMCVNTIYYLRINEYWIKRSKGWLVVMANYVCILCVWTFKIFYSNKRILTQ